MDFFSIIGTIASIGSVPLSIYLYIKNKENNVDRIKREIVKTLSHQIGDRRQLTSFEIQTVINSKTRESKISSDKITVTYIIEDLVAETISNPLLDKNIKETIINELKNIYFKGELLTRIDNIEIRTRSENKSNKADNSIENEIKNIIEKRNDLKEELKSQTKTSAKTSEIYALISGIVTAIATGLFAMNDKINAMSKPINDFLEKNSFYASIVASLVIATIAFLTLIIYNYFKKK